MVGMKATRLYTRAYLTRIRYREEAARFDDLSKIEVQVKPRAHAK